MDDWLQDCYTGGREEGVSSNVPSSLAGVAHPRIERVVLLIHWRHVCTGSLSSAREHMIGVYEDFTAGSWG